MSWLLPCVEGVVRGVTALKAMPIGALPHTASCAESEKATQKKGPRSDFADVPTTDELPGFGHSRSCDTLSEISERFERSDSDASSRGRLDSADPHQEIDGAITAATLMLPWAESGLEMVRTLQAAPRNQGQVDLMRTIATGEFVAVKRMPNSWMRSGPGEFEEHSGGSLERPWFDIGVTAYLHGQGFRYTCQPQGIYRDERFTYVASEYACGGDLFGLMDRDPSPGEAREGLIRPIMQQVFTAVAWLHDRGIAHCDISLENILLAGEGTVKLIDFGMATLSRSRTEGCGKKSYIAPEMFKGSHDPFRSDAFALGVVLFSVAARAYPWEATRPGSCRLFDFVRVYGLRNFIKRRKVWKGNGQTLLEVFSAPLVDLTEGLLSMDPESRLTLGERCFRKWRVRPSVWDSKWLKQERIHREGS